MLIVDIEKTLNADIRSGLGESLADQAYRKLEEMIVTLELAPGTVLSEAALSAHLGIGRTPIREALQRLAAEHLVVIMPRRGVMVTEVDLRRQLLLLEVRREIERVVATRAARRSTREEKAQLAVMADEMESAAARGDDTTFLRVDHAFNLFVAQCARNPFAIGAIGPLHALSRRFWYMHYKLAADMPLAARLHADVMRAVAAGDEAAASNASDRLMDYIESMAHSTLELTWGH